MAGSYAPAVPVARGASVGVRGPPGDEKSGGRTGGHPTTAEYMRDEPAWHTKIMTRGRKKSSEKRRNVKVESAHGARRGSGWANPLPEATRSPVGERGRPDVGRGAEKTRWSNVPPSDHRMSHAGPSRLA